MTTNYPALERLSRSMSATSPAASSEADGLGAVELGAGGELKAPQFLFRQRRLGVGVVLLAGEQTPERQASLRVAMTIAME